MEDDHLEYNSILLDNLYRYNAETEACELVAVNGLAVKQIYKGDFLFTSKYANALEQAHEIRRRVKKAKADREAAQALELDTHRYEWTEAEIVEAVTEVVKKRYGISYQDYLQKVENKEVDRCRDSEILGLLATIGIGNTQGGQV